MPLVDLVMPKMGESIMEATILKWHKQPGDAVKQDETVLEIATDKVDSEVPSIVEGVMEELLFQVNDVVPIGAVIARVRTAAKETASADGGQSLAPAGANGAVPNSQSPTANYPAQSQPAVAQLTATTAPASNGARFYSPLVLNIASSEGVPLGELEAIRGSGNEGRVTKKDILQYVAERRSGVQSPERTAQPAVVSSSISNIPARDQYTAPTPTPQPTIYTGNVEILEMDRMRRLIADHMVRSKHTSPHVTSFTEADVTNMVQWRSRVKKEFEKRENSKITFTPLFIEAIVHCIKKYPLINSSLDGDKIIIKKDI